MSSNRDERRQKTCSSLVEESPSTDSLYAAEKYFAMLAVRMLVCNSLIPKSAGLRLHRCTGRALTPREGGPATTESESECHDHIRCRTGTQSP